MKRHDPCGGVGAVMRAVIVPWYSRCVSDLKMGFLGCGSGFWVCGSGGVLESCTFSLHDRRAKRGCHE